MNTELLVLRGMIASLTEEEQAEVKEATSALREVMKCFSETSGLLALSVICLEAS